MANKLKDASICSAGCAQKVITPPLGVSLAGYFHDRVGESIRDDLFAKAIVLEYEDSQMALVSLDLINVTEELTTPAKEFISQEVGIPAENVLICATHTHTGPEVRQSGVVGRSEEWVAGLPRLIADTVKAAADSTFPATLRRGCIEAHGYAYNRLFRLKDGKEQFGIRGREDEVGWCGRAN